MIPKLGALTTSDGEDLSPTLAQVCEGPHKAAKFAARAAKMVGAVTDHTPGDLLRLFRDTVRKANPYHDADGRFTTAENAVEPSFEAGPEGSINVKTPSGNLIASYNLVSEADEQWGPALYQKVGKNGVLDGPMIEEKQIKEQYKGPPKKEAKPEPSKDIFDYFDKPEEMSEFVAGAESPKPDATGKYTLKNGATIAPDPYGGIQVKDASGEVVATYADAGGGIYSKFDPNTGALGDEMFAMPDIVNEHNKAQPVPTVDVSQPGKLVFTNTSGEKFTWIQTGPDSYAPTTGGDDPNFVSIPGQNTGPSMSMKAALQQWGIKASSVPAEPISFKPVSKFKMDASGAILVETTAPGLTTNETWEPSDDFDTKTGKQLYVNSDDPNSEAKTADDLLNGSYFEQVDTTYPSGKVAFSPTKNSANIYDANGKKVGEVKFAGTTDLDGNKLYNGLGLSQVTEAQLKAAYETPLPKAASAQSAAAPAAPKQSVKMDVKTGSTGNVLMYGPDGKKHQTWLKHPSKTGPNGEPLYFTGKHGGKDKAITLDEAKKVTQKELDDKHGVAAPAGTSTPAAKPSTPAKPPPPKPSSTGPIVVPASEIKTTEYSVKKLPDGNFQELEDGVHMATWKKTSQLSPEGEPLYKKSFYDETYTESELEVMIAHKNQITKPPKDDEFPAYSTPGGGSAKDEGYNQAMKRFNKYSSAEWKQLSKAEQGHLYKYTADSKRLNAFVSGSYNPSQDHDAKSPEFWQKRADALDAALARTKVPENVITYRAMDARSLGWDMSKFSKDPSSFEKQASEMVGSTFTDPAYGSTSMSYGVARGFLRQERVMLNVRVAKGSPGFWFGNDGDKTSYTNEAELLLPRSTVYRITRVTWTEIHGVRKPVFDVDVVHM